MRTSMENGTKVYAFVQDPGEGARNIYRGTDEEYNGQVLAELCQEWADKERPDAEEGSIRTVVITNEDLPSNKERGEAAIKYLSQDKRFDIIDTQDCEQSIVAAQTVTENLFAKHGDTIDCILSIAPGLGVLAYLDSDACVAADPVSKCVVSSEINSELADYIKRGLYDGTAVNGGNPADNAATQVKEIDMLLHDEIEDGFSSVDIGKVTADNLADYGY